MALIALSGKIGSGKNTVGSIIQYLVWKDRVESGRISFSNYSLKDFDKFDFGYQMSGWKQVSFASKLKDIVCLLIGCTREELENQEFKNKELGEEWVRYGYANGFYYTGESPIMINEACNKEKYEEELKTNHQTAYKESYTPRKLLQFIGTELFRKQLHHDIWVNALMSDYKGSPYRENWRNDTGLYENRYPNWIIADMRFPNELEAVKKRNGITIRVNRYSSTCVCVDDSSLDCLTPCSRKPQHESEVALDHVTDWDYVIDNSGTIEELVEKVRTILVNEKII
ncbi:MAG TPA: hypothetical protein PKD16_01315 [Saprospiraceae bacterium]|jgi:hypothetical protein|nr:hypothetical protein [Saprospiraceae bacterium]